MNDVTRQVQWTPVAAAVLVIIAIAVGSGADTADTSATPGVRALHAPGTDALQVAPPADTPASQARDARHRLPPLSSTTDVMRARAAAGSAPAGGSAAEAPREQVRTETRTTETPDAVATMSMRVTAYCVCRRCCGRNADGRTATGHRIRPQDFIVAVDPRVIPLGSLLEIPGYTRPGHPALAVDTGRVIRGRRADVLMTVPKGGRSAHSRARHWGVQNLDVRVLRWGWGD